MSEQLISYTGKFIRSFTFSGKTHAVKTWKEMLVKLLSELYSLHREDFKKVLSLGTEAHPYVSIDVFKFTWPLEIPGTRYYVETNLSADRTVLRAQELIVLFGHSPDDLTIGVAP